MPLNKVKFALEAEVNILEIIENITAIKGEIYGKMLESLFNIWGVTTIALASSSLSEDVATAVMDDLVETMALAYTGIMSFPEKIQKRMVQKTCNDFIKDLDTLIAKKQEIERKYHEP